MATPRKRVARETGLEPATSGVTGRRSNQLSYSRIGEPLGPLNVTLMYPAPLFKSSAPFRIRHKNFTEASEAVENYYASSHKPRSLNKNTSMRAPEGHRSGRLWLRWKKVAVFAGGIGSLRRLTFRFVLSDGAETARKRKLVGDDGLEPPTFSV